MVSEPAVLPKTKPDAVLPSAEGGHVPKAGFLALTLGSIGVVYGDIGTSPLYAMRVAVLAAVGEGGTITEGVILGLLSLIFWTLIVVVTLKYIVILLRADNHGEGGTLSLTALAFQALGRGTPLVLILGMLGASMFYGSTLITPALSVLSAVEGLTVVTERFDHLVLPLAIVILAVLFSVQSRGTARVSAFFGPLTVFWFLVIALGGIAQIVGNPAVLKALNPLYGVAFLLDHGAVGLATLGAVFLVATGSEALYNDLGHFGRRPIQMAWVGLVLPALLLNYFGQGALLLADPRTLTNPFYLLFPDWALYPMVALATAATVIASQAVITGSYSITRQAIQLGLFPRLEVRHTSAALAGQIYMPRVNWLLLAGVVFLVVVFRSSDNLANAYVLAVATANLMSATLGFIVIWKVWKWRFLGAALLMFPFVGVDGVFVGAASMKLTEGAWLPMVVGACIVLVMLTWRKGTRILFDKTRRLEVPLLDLVDNLEKNPPHKVPGTAIFLTGDPTSTPTALLHSLKHFKVLHENNVILTIVTSDTPRVDPDERVTMDWVSKSFARMTVRYGFMESPNLPRALAIARKLGWTFDIMSTSFFLSRRSVKAAAHSGMPLWQDKLFIVLARSADDASSYFQIPTDRVVEIGTQITV